MSEAIKEALLALDPANDDQWTVDGAPKLDALNLKDVKRQDVVKAAPHFTRTNPRFDTPAEAKAKEEAKVQELKKLNEVEAAAAEVDRTGKVLDDLERKRVENLKEMQKAHAEHDLAQRKLASFQGARTGQADIMDYLASVRRDLDAKAEKAKVA